MRSINANSAMDRTPELYSQQQKLSGARRLKD
jgi:hypothetical protein